MTYLLCILTDFLDFEVYIIQCGQKYGQPHRILATDNQGGEAHWKQSQPH